MDNGNFRRRATNKLYRLLQLAGNLVAVGNFTALRANLRGNIFNDNDAFAQVRQKICKFVDKMSFAHEAPHFTHFFEFCAANHMQSLRRPNV